MYGWLDPLIQVTFRIHVQSYFLYSSTPYTLCLLSSKDTLPGLYKRHKSLLVGRKTKALHADRPTDRTTDRGADTLLSRFVATKKKRGYIYDQ